MSPRHFSKALSNPIYTKDLENKLQPGMNAWYMFFAITGLDKTITKMFSYTPEQIKTNPVKDSQSGIQE